MKRSLNSIFLFLSLLTCSVHAQVTIAPTNLFLDNQTRFGTYMVINGSNTPQEISIEFFFGYSETDINGERINITDNQEIEASHSVAESIRAFPQNFILQPGQRQIVRLRINAPNNSQDGTFWSRIKTTSTPESPPVEIGSDDNVTARVGINIEQITGLFYKSGEVTTGIEVEGIKTSFPDGNEDQLVVLTDYQRTGNSPFLGSITTTLQNQNGEILAQGFRSTTLFFDGTQKEELDISGLSPGKYTVQVHFETRRSDISSTDLVQMEPVTATTTVTIP
ncbi:fimbrial biogenesis chaperone [Gracilimonas halophila]|uniref:P pilus assembly protein, chaperone PapD n=1 Tax=Gracilimonas halophila TaxID=1834464 RepID=A0ABW5JM01_9BACT